MRRVLGLLATVAVLVGGVLLLRGASPEDDGLTYRVVMDNAFGLTTGADLRVAGVRVGSVDELDVERRTARAVAIVKVDRPEFGRLRRDVRCTVQPQSLIGEYFLDCDPGTAAEALGDGDTVPASQTFGTVPPDLVQNVLRQPYTRRLSILLSEFGAGLGARGPELNETIRRAIPALRQTDRVLKVLADEKQALQALVNDSDTVVTELAGRRDEVATFVREARDTAAVSAGRSEDLRATIRGLPSVLRELRPTLRDLGTAAEQQTPALDDLRAAADPLRALSRDLGPFSEAATPALRALGRASQTGRAAVKEARDTVQKARAVTEASVEPVTNLRYVLEHIDDRDNAVEPNRLAPVPAKGFTGLEAFLNYFFVQAQAINVFDERGYFLKLNLAYSECSRYHSAVSARNHPERRAKCGGALGPSAPGIDTDLNTRGAPPGTTAARNAATPAGTGAGTGVPAPALTPVPTTTTPPAPSPAAPAGLDLSKPIESAGNAVRGLLDHLLKP